MVQIRFTAAALIAATIIAPAVANSVYPEDSLVTRESNEIDDLLTRESDFDAREFDEELVERDPLFSKFAHFFRKKAEAAAPEQGASLEGREFEDEEIMAREFDEYFRRELEELMERDPKFGFGHLGRFFGKKSSHVAADASADSSNNNNEPREFDEDIEARDFEEDIEAREFEEDIEARDFEEDIEARDFEEDIEARDFDEDLEARDFEEDIEAREPEYEEVLERYFDDLYERELSEEIELLERDLNGEDEIIERDIESDLFEREDSEELVSREPLFNGIKNWFNNLFHHKKPAAPPAAAAEGSTNEAREFEIDELD